MKCPRFKQLLQIVKTALFTGELESESVCHFFVLKLTRIVSECLANV